MMAMEEGLDPQGPEAVFDGWLTRAELAGQLKLSVGTLAKWGHRGFGPVGVRIGTRVYYRVETVQEWLRQQEERVSRRRHG